MYPSQWRGWVHVKAYTILNNAEKDSLFAFAPCERPIDRVQNHKVGDESTVSATCSLRLRAWNRACQNSFVCCSKSTTDDLEAAPKLHACINHWNPGKQHDSWKTGTVYGWRRSAPGHVVEHIGGN